MTRRLAFRVMLTAGAALYGVLAIVSGMDRISEQVPAAPALTGWAYDAGATRARGTFALVADNPQESALYARQSLLANPMESLAISLLGEAQIQQQDNAGADKAFRVAGQLGWRDAAVQTYWMQRSLAVGDYAIAAERLDALLRQTPLFDRRKPLVDALLATPQGRAALASRLRLGPAWATTFIIDVTGDTPETALERAEVVEAAGPGPWTCAQAGILADRLIAQQAYPEASRVWHQNCPARGGLLYDGGFDNVVTTNQPHGFDWRLSDRGDIDIRPGCDASGSSYLDISVSSPFRQDMLSQTVVLAPGTYRLTWTAQSLKGSASEALGVSLACQGQPGTPIRGIRIPGTVDRFKQDFVFDAACTVRRLVFTMDPSTSVRLREVGLAKL